MTRWYGKIGYVVTAETRPGIWEEQETERNYYGDVIRNKRRLQSSGQVNDNIVLSNEISIVADPYANENYSAIRWVEFMGVKWKVSDIEVSHPRLILTLGEVYNGDST